MKTLTKYALLTVQTETPKTKAGWRTQISFGNLGVGYLHNGQVGITWERRGDAIVRKGKERPPKKMTLALTVDELRAILKEVEEIQAHGEPWHNADERCDDCGQPMTQTHLHSSSN